MSHRAGCNCHQCSKRDEEHRRLAQFMLTSLVAIMALASVYVGARYLIEQVIR